MDFVSIDFVRSMGLKPCTRTQHNHHLPHIEAAGCTTLTTHGVYHLHCSTTDKWGREFSFVRPFVAITRSPKDTPILLGRLPFGIYGLRSTTENQNGNSNANRMWRCIRRSDFISYSLNAHLSRYTPSSPDLSSHRYLKSSKPTAYIS